MYGLSPQPQSVYVTGYPKRSVVVPNPVVHFEITGADGSALQSFYRELFDWKIDANNEWQYGVVETGGEGGINGGISGAQDGSARVSVYAEVDDLQAYLDKAEGLGASVVMPVTDMGDFAIALFTDPAGNVTGLVKNSGNQ